MEQNHASAVEHIEHIAQYTLKELLDRALHGPFQEKPFHMHISPLMDLYGSELAKRANQNIILLMTEWAKINI